ncbi:hypothetical protein LX36DRAFT_656386 [Colletotrichum falcatum]|nr:hypothetical protein LX36DRAFT_656386 [Colletotrichum falcatum]
MKFVLLAVFTALVSANPALKTYARDSAELHALGIRDTTCPHSTCNGGCGSCTDGTNVCCPNDVSQPCYVFSC